MVSSTLTMTIWALCWLWCLLLSCLCSLCCCWCWYGLDASWSCNQDETVFETCVRECVFKAWSDQDSHNSNHRTRHTNTADQQRTHLRRLLHSRRHRRVTCKFVMCVCVFYLLLCCVFAYLLNVCATCCWFVTVLLVVWFVFVFYIFYNKVAKLQLKHVKLLFCATCDL